MFRHIRHALVYVFAAALASTGLAYAATGNLNPVDAVLSAASSDPGPAVDEAALETTADELGDSDVTDTDGDDDGDPTGSSPTTPTAKGPEWSTEGCPEGFSGNHGQHVSASDDKREAAHSPCGKPVHEDGGAEADGEDHRPSGAGRPSEADGAHPRDHGRAIADEASGGRSAGPGGNERGGPPR